MRKNKDGNVNENEIMTADQFRSKGGNFTEGTNVIENIDQFRHLVRPSHG